MVDGLALLSRPSLCSNSERPMAAVQVEGMEVASLL